MDAKREWAYRAIQNLFEHADAFALQSLSDEPEWDKLLTLFAHRLAEVADKLTPSELAGLAKIGMSIARKSRGLA
jgi:hypothetical protein